jgi:hypothetical protein
MLNISRIPANDLLNLYPFYQEIRNKFGIIQEFLRERNNEELLRNSYTHLILSLGK